MRPSPHPGTYMSTGTPQSVVREKDSSDTAKTSVCHWLSIRAGLRKDTRVCQVPAASWLRKRKCSRVGEYRRPSSSASGPSATTVNRYSFFCKRGWAGECGQVRAGGEGGR